VGIFAVLSIEMFDRECRRTIVAGDAPQAVLPSSAVRRVVAVVAVLAGAVALSAGAPASTLRAACTPKAVTVKGKPGVVECGPATATVKFQGKTIRYSGGTCTTVGPSFSLYIGTKVTGGGSPHLFYLSLEKRPGTTYTPATALVGIQLDYASYHLQTGTLTVKPGLKGGTFKGQFMKFPSTKLAGPASGSFSC
jgi:hypothetical protein